MNVTYSIIDATKDDWTQRLSSLRARLSPDGDMMTPASRAKTEQVFGEALTAKQVVERICRDVQEKGMAAILDYGERIDGTPLTSKSIRVSPDELADAHAAADSDFLAMIRRVRDRIERFQTSILHRERQFRPDEHVRILQRYTPLTRAGLCVPGGAAAYPSTLLMTAVPAQVAGVEELAVVAPPTEFGANNPDILAVCKELGISEVYRVGGAQAVAALAYGAGDDVRPVDKIVGPGNLFVALAKKYVFGDVDIDSIAGPSEVVVIADDSADPAETASDLLAQAEHSPGASLLVSWNGAWMDRVIDSLKRLTPRIDRAEATQVSLAEYGAAILVKDADQAVEVTDLIAPEHLHIMTQGGRELALRIRNAGATFLGRYTPVAVGDYTAGPSHVLPTGGTPRWASGLSCNSFLRSHALVEYSREALDEVGADIEMLARREQLTAHAASVGIRLGRGPLFDSEET